METEKLEKIRKLYENVAISELTEREKRLKKLLSAENHDNFSALPAGSYRILQFENSNFPELRNTLELLLPDFVTANKEEKYVVERFSGDNLTKSELFDVLQTLSQDMAQEISAYIGFFVEKSELNKMYQEERKAFSKKQTFSEFIIAQSLEKNESTILQKIRSALLADSENIELVRALYQTNGNQAQAAKILYVHRNTLLNKIKKYEQKYSLQLIGSDLILAYNLL
ncbi:helix-turn-helix domain-containing protein [Lactococcus nasutitermitis]|uniref:Helix-turn-helix domain-containing protein n=1 Tax=Lactococcus nasutitermitis TaxID=1652957 RepID=A0ABV9JEU5_9LACT|nr:helix-turn-helix domain-containing protein [Lactococcus nasutitermitis]